MLQESILGKTCRCWTDSAVFAVLCRLWRALCRACAGSLLLRLAFGPSRGDALYRESLAGGIQRGVVNGVLFLLRPLARGGRDSAICGLLRGSALLRLEVLFGAFCCVMFIVPHDNWNNLWALIAALVFLALYLLSAAGGRRRTLYPDELGLGLALFALACVLSLLFSTARHSSLRVLLYYLTAFLLCYLTVAFCRERADLRRLLAFFYASMLVVSLYAIAQRLLNLVEVDYLFTDLSINEGVPGRVYASLDNPNNLSGFLQVFLPLGAAFAGGTRNGRRRALLTLGLAFPVLAMVMTYSRSGWLAMLLAAFVYVFYCNKRLVPALVLLALLALPILPASVMTRLSTIFNSRDTSRNHRIAIWQGVLRLLSDRGYWITGIGLGPDTFKNIYPDYAVPLGRTGAYHSQMLYLELDLEMGIVGALSFFWMLLKLAGRAGRAIYRRGEQSLRLLLIAVVSAVAALAVSGVAEFVWYYQRCIFAFFLFLGVAMAALRIAEREQTL